MIIVILYGRRYLTHFYIITSLVSRHNLTSSYILPPPPPYVQILATPLTFGCRSPPWSRSWIPSHNLPLLLRSLEVSNLSCIYILPTSWVRLTLMVDCGCDLKRIYRRHLCFVDALLICGDSKSICWVVIHRFSHSPSRIPPLIRHWMMVRGARMCGGCYQ
jgi:hypothetical protein